MAAATVSTTWIENCGSLNLRIVTFSDIDDASTYASGLDSVVAYWVQETDAASSTKFGIAVAESSGTFTFQTDEANRTGILFILSRD